jgi:pilus assembly protein Flp/PilA
MQLFHRFVREEEGADATEYALMLGLVALAIIGAVVGLGDNLKSAFNNIADTVSNHTAPSA